MTDRSTRQTIADIIREGAMQPAIAAAIYDPADRAAETILTRLRELGWNPPLPETRRVHWTQLIHEGTTPNEVIAGRTGPVARVEVLAGGTVRVHCEGPGGYVVLTREDDGCIEVIVDEDRPPNEAQPGWIVNPGGKIPRDWEYYDASALAWKRQTARSHIPISADRVTIVRPPKP
jgi:hypothetical protein